MSFKKLFIKNENNPTNSSPADVLSVISIFNIFGLRQREKTYSQKIKLNNAPKKNSIEDNFAHKYIPPTSDIMPVIPVITARESINAPDESFVGVDLIMRDMLGRNFHAI